MEFSFPVLLADIGGTNTRFALLQGPEAPPVAWPRLKTGHYASFEEALSFVLKESSRRPRSLIVCAAGPVEGRCVKLTNATWTIDGPRVAAALGFAQGLLLNDFEAQAYSLPALMPAWVTPIGEPLAPKAGPQLVIGVGTGLGVAALIEIGGRYLALPSEAGHMDFGPGCEDDYALWAHLPRDLSGRISSETILSGPGLLRLHLARLAVQGGPAAPPNEIILTENALARPAGPEAETLRLFWTILARLAGDLALIFMATGGVAFSGGVLPRIARFCDALSFRAAFENKTQFAALLRAIATRLICSEDAVLTGMARIATTPQNYAIDYGRRAWR